MKIYITILSIFLVGCSTQTKPSFMVHRDVAYIPLSTCPQPPQLESIKLPIDRISNETPYSEVVKLYAATIEMLKGEIFIRDLILKGYKVENGNINFSELNSEE